MLVITAGARYIDIDAYACIVAYAELLNLLGKNAVGATTAPLNESITKRLRELPVPSVHDYKTGQADTFIMVDLSDPSQFDTIVDVGRVVEVFDHHAGFEDFWSERIGAGSHIEFIGAAATLIYEQWEKAGKLLEMSRVSAELLAAAIQDNTLHFLAGVTTDRDRTAYAFLASHAHLDEQWVAEYFSDCQASTLVDVPTSLRNDTKYFRWPNLAPELTMGQLVLWDAHEVAASGIETFVKTLATPGKAWLVNLVSISEKRSYFVTDSSEVKAWLHALIGVGFDGDIAVADRLWLRKEVLKAALSQPALN